MSYADHGSQHGHGLQRPEPHRLTSLGWLTMERPPLGAAFRIFAEAEYWIERELKVKIGWKDSDIVRQFDQLVKRRFS